MDLSQSANQLYMLGMLNSLRTGNPLFDGIFILLLPTIMNYISQIAYTIMSRITQSAKKLSNQDFYVKRIEYSMTPNKAYSNYHLYTAMCVYINSLNLDLKNSEIESIFNSSDDSPRGMTPFPSKNDQMKQLKILAKPSINSWIATDIGVELLFEKNVQNQNQDPGRNPNQQSQQIIYSISIRSRTSSSIENFINDSIEYYKKTLDADNDTKRYMYLPKYGPFFSDGSNVSFDAYVLSESKTFDSLFIPNKSELLTTLNHFQNHTGKYGIPGIKQQLGLLLHGPSGTGKTSLIKSIANKFNRNIVTIPLSLLTTNYELFELMFNLSYNTADKKMMEFHRQTGMPLPTIKTLDFTDIVFVIEDIDAVSNIVHERSNGIEIPEEVDDDDKEDKEARDKLDRMNNTLDAITTHFGMMPPGMVPPGAIGPKRPKDKEKINDKLNLAGILNAIDGIVDAPGRIIIITSNFPERLDKALIRPGRIDKIIKLNYIAEEQAVEMCNHFFGSKEVAVFEKELREIIGNNKFTPAQIEQFALESNNIEQLINNLKNI